MLIRPILSHALKAEIGKISKAGQELKREKEERLFK